MKILITSNTDKPHQYLWSKVLETKHDVYIFAQIHLVKDNNKKVSFFERIKNIILRYASLSGLVRVIKRFKDKKINAFF